MNRNSLALVTCWCHHLVSVRGHATSTPCLSIRLRMLPAGRLETKEVLIDLLALFGSHEWIEDAIRCCGD